MHNLSADPTHIIRSLQLVTNNHFPAKLILPITTEGHKSLQIPHKHFDEFKMKLTHQHQPIKDKKIHASSIESPLVIGVNLIYNAATDAYIFDPS